MQSSSLEHLHAARRSSMTGKGKEAHPSVLQPHDSIRRKSQQSTDTDDDGGTWTVSGHHVSFHNYNQDTYWDKFLERCSRCEIWAKYSLFSLNVIAWIGGIVCIMVGIWAIYDKGEFGSLRNIMLDPVYFIIAVGTLVVVVSTFGCIGTLRENIWLLTVFCCLLVALFMLEVGCGVYTFVRLNDVKSTATKWVKKAIVIYDDDLNLKNLIDYIQKEYKCCGGASYSDWEVNKYFNCSYTIPSGCGVPTSCCLRKTDVMCGYKSRIYGVTYAKHTINTSGCVDNLTLIMQQDFYIIGLIVFGIGLLEIVSILLAANVTNHVIKVRNNLTRQRNIQEQMTQFPSGFGEAL